MYKRNPYTSTLNRKQLDDEDENTLKVRKNSDSGFRNLPDKSVGQESKPKNLPDYSKKPATIQKLPQRIPTDTGDAFGIDAESKKRLSDLRTRFIGQSNGREGTRIKNSVQGVLSNKYGKLDTQHIFDDIDDDTVERNIDVAKSAINTNIERGTLSKDYKTKYPNLLDGMTMFYAAGEKGNSKAMSKSKEAAYSENSVSNLSNNTNSKPVATPYSYTSEKKDSSDSNYMTRYTGKNGASYREDTSEESEVLGQISGNSEVQFTGRKRIDENDKAWAQVIVDGKKVWVEANDLRTAKPETQTKQETKPFYESTAKDNNKLHPWSQSPEEMFEVIEQGIYENYKPGKISTTLDKYDPSEYIKNGVINFDISDVLENFKDKDFASAYFDIVRNVNEIISPQANPMDELKKLSRFVWKAGCDYYLRPKDCTVSADMLEHSLQEHPKDVVFYEDAEVVKKIKQDTEFFSHLDEIVYKIENNIPLDEDTDKSHRFKTGDLFYSIHRCELYIDNIICNEDGTKDILVHIHDTYDYTEILTAMEGDRYGMSGSFSSVVNDAATITSKLDAINPYEVDMYFTIRR